MDFPLAAGDASLKVVGDVGLSEGGESSTSEVFPADRRMSRAEGAVGGRGAGSVGAARRGSGTVTSTRPLTADALTAPSGGRGGLSANVSASSETGAGGGWMKRERCSAVAIRHAEPYRQGVRVAVGSDDE